MRSVFAIRGGAKGAVESPIVGTEERRWVMEREGSEAEGVEGCRGNWFEGIGVEDVGQVRDAKC